MTEQHWYTGLVDVGPFGMNPPGFADPRLRHLGRAIKHQADTIGDRIFLMAGDQKLSFADVNQSVNALAAGLKSLGITRGDHVGFYANSSPDIIILTLAVNKLGAIWVPINGDYKGEWLLDTITRSRPVCLVTDADHAGRVMDIADRLQSVHIVTIGDSAGIDGAVRWDDLLIYGAPEPDLSGLSNLDPSAVLWTSGTTGKSKGVIQSHNVWFHSIASALAVFGGTEQGDVIYSVMPMYNSAAWVTAIYRALFAGVPLSLDPHFSVSNFWQRIDQFGATQCMTLGAMHMYLWNAPPKDDDAAHALKKLLAVPIPANIAEAFSKRFDVELLPAGLGQSESLCLTTHYPAVPEPLPPGSCGRPGAGLSARIVTDTGADAKTGEAGELWVKPEAQGVIFSGYLDDEAATRSAFEGDWYKTGDLVRREDNGFYYFVDRKKDSVRLKGRNISTFEVEHVVRSHAAISECAAFGIPSEELSSEDELKLNIVLKPDAQLQPEELARYINENAPYFFVPRYIEIVKSLPYTPTNKIQKFKLRELGVTKASWDAQAAGFKAKR